MPFGIDMALYCCVQGETDMQTEQRIVTVMLERNQLAAENKSLHVKLALLTNDKHASSLAHVRCHTLPCGTLRIYVVNAEAMLRSALSLPSIKYRKPHVVYVAFGGQLHRERLS